MSRQGANFAAITRVSEQLHETSEIVRKGRPINAVARDAALDAFRVLHDALTNPNDKYRLAAAQALIAAHVKLETAKQEPKSAAEQLSPEEREERLLAALNNPDGDLAQALHKAGYIQVQNKDD
jgi:hypothetical protein